METNKKSLVELIYDEKNESFIIKRTKEKVRVEAIEYPERLQSEGHNCTIRRPSKRENIKKISRICRCFFYKLYP